MRCAFQRANSFHCKFFQWLFCAFRDATTSGSWKSGPLSLPHISCFFFSPLPGSRGTDRLVRSLSTAVGTRQEERCCRKNSTRGATRGSIRITATQKSGVHPRPNLNDARTNRTMPEQLVLDFPSSAKLGSGPCGKILLQTGIWHHCQETRLTRKETASDGLETGDHVGEIATMCGTRFHPRSGTSSLLVPPSADVSR